MNQSASLVLGGLKNGDQDSVVIEESKSNSKKILQ